MQVCYCNESNQEDQEDTKKSSRAIHAGMSPQIKAGFHQVCQVFCVNDQVLFLGMGARGKGQRLFPRLSM